MRKTLSQMMGMKHSKMSGPMKKMEQREYSKKGLPAKAMAKHETAEYGKGKRCPRCGGTNCKC